MDTTLSTTDLEQKLAKANGRAIDLATNIDHWIDRSTLIRAMIRAALQSIEAGSNANGEGDRDARMEALNDARLLNEAAVEQLDALLIPDWCGSALITSELEPEA